MKKYLTIKKMIILFLLINLFIMPTYALEDIEITDKVVELEWGSEAVDAFRSFELTINTSDEVSYESSNEAIVTVDENGRLLSRGYGKAIISVTNNSTGHSDQIEVRVFLVGDEETPLSPITFIKPYVNGYENGSFMPLLDITGYELSVMLAAALDLPLIEEKNSKWYDASLEALIENQIITSESIFASNNYISRADFALLLESTLKKEKREFLLDGFPMVYDIHEDSIAKTAIYTLLELEIMFLDEESLFKADNYVSRGQAVKIINRLIGRQPYLLGESDFEDIMKDDIFYGDIDAASSFYNLKYDN